MKNIHLIPTNKPSRLWINNLKRRLELDKDVLIGSNTAKHIYITSDEALPYDSSIFDNGAFYHRDAAGDVHIITKHTFKPNPRFCKRIILTTDQDLINDGVQAIDDEFLEWFVNNTSCEEVEIEKVLVTNSGLGYQEYAVLDSNFKVIEINAKIPQTSYCLGKVTILNSYEYVVNYEIIIPKEEPKTLTKLEIARNIAAIGIGKKEEPKQETLEEAAERWFKEIGHDASFIKAIEFGAKWQQERMYSEEEVYKKLHNLMTDIKLQGVVINDDIDLKKWFEQFKKK